MAAVRLKMLVGGLWLWCPAEATAACMPWSGVCSIRMRQRCECRVVMYSCHVYGLEMSI